MTYASAAAGTSRRRSLPSSPSASAGETIAPGEALQRRLARHQHGGARVGRQRGAAGGGERRVEREVRAAGLQHRQQRHHQLGGALQHHPHARLRAHAGRAEPPRQPVGAPRSAPRR